MSKGYIVPDVNTFPPPPEPNPAPTPRTEVQFDTNKLRELVDADTLMIKKLRARAEKAEANLATSVAFVARLQERQRELMKEADELWHERDALRAEVERLKAHEGDLVIGAGILNGARQQEAESVDQLRAEVERLHKMCANAQLSAKVALESNQKLRAELASAQEDTERLDWLEKKPGSCYASVEPDGDILMHFVAVPEAPAKDRRGYVEPTVRAAIDQARKARP